MTTSIEIDFSKLSDKELASLYIQGIQVYDDQIEIMDYVRKKSIEVRNDLVEFEKELKKRKIEIKTIEEETNESSTGR